MENSEKKKWLTKRKIIIGAVLLVTILISFVVIKFIFIDEGMERVYLSLDARADFMIISREGSQKCFLISDKKEISNFLKLHTWRSSHLPCCWGGMDSEYTVKIINGDKITSTIYFNDYWTTYSDSSTPYNKEFYNELQKYISSFNENENPLYQYTFQVRNSKDFHALKEQIYNDGNGNIAYLPGGSIIATKPSITLSYATVAKNEKEWNNAFRNSHQLGEFSCDDYFIPFVDDLKERELFFDNSTVSFSSGNGLNFSRRITIYLNRSLTESEIKEIKNKSTETYIVGNPQGFHPVTNFLYNEVEEYEIKVIFDKDQSSDELKDFCEKHSVDNFNYDKELLNFDELSIYYIRGNRMDGYRSLCLTSDLQLTVKEYAPIRFEPFTDADPDYTIVEERKISDNDYRMIQQTLSNYEVLQIPNNLGFGSYEFDNFIFIGVKINGKLFMCGGQDPFSHDERFFRIRTKIFEILDIDY